MKLITLATSQNRNIVDTKHIDFVSDIRIIYRPLRKEIPTDSSRNPISGNALYIMFPN